MAAKKYNQTAPVKILWGDRTLQAAEFADVPPAHRVPDANDPEWNELVDDAILQSRTTDQTLLSNLEVNADKSLIARYGATAGYRLRQSPSAGGGIGPFASTAFDAVPGIDRTSIFNVDGSEWVKIGGGGVDTDFLGGTMVNPVFNKPTVSLTNGVLGWDSVKDQYVYGSGNLVGELLGLYSTREIVINKSYGFNSKNAAPQSFGIPTPTVILEGTGAAASDNPQADSTFTQYTTGNASGNRAGTQSSTFVLNRRPHQPNLGCMFRTGASVADLRFWIVLTSADIGATDDPADGHLIGLRFSTTTDANFKAVSKNGTTLNVQQIGTGIVPAINTTYKLYVIWTSIGRAIVGLQTGATVGLIAVTLNLPGITTNLGFQATLETKTAASKVWNLSHLKVEHL